MTSEKIVKKGSKVKVHYRGTLNDGSIFDTSEGKLPLSFEAGAGHVIPGFDSGVMGMKVGDEKEVLCKASDAYGEYRNDLVQTVPRSMFAEAEKQLVSQGKKLEKGIVFGLRTPDGRIMHATVLEVEKDALKLDMNHMLAGKDLRFRIKVEDIE